jgi:hypothetical protein
VTPKTSRRWLAVILAVLLLGSPAMPTAAQSSPVQVVPEPGVAPEAVLDVQRGIELSLLFFRTEYGLDLLRQVRIVVVPDRAGYVAALLRELRISEAEAERRARTSTAWTAGFVIIATVTSSSTRASRMYLMAHELTHQLQMQVSAPANPWRLYWMAEGAADAVAARIVESNGYAPAGAYQQRWIAVLKRAANRPGLLELNTQEGWFASLDRSGSATTYAVAALAAAYLMERSGNGAILTHFRALSTRSDGAAAFQQAFSRTLETFLEEFRRTLGDQLSRGIPSRIRAA